jgi:hypothetical protein
MTASVSPEVKKPKRDEFHLNCHDCGKFVEAVMRVRKDDPSKKHSLCGQCASDYDSGYESW